LLQFFILLSDVLSQFYSGHSIPLELLKRAARFNRLNGVNKQLISEMM
jgi:hypothetical protein